MSKQIQDGFVWNGSQLWPTEEKKMATKQSMEEFIAMKSKEYRDIIVGWQEEVIRLQNEIKNKNDQIEMLQNMVRSYQADNEKDFSAHD